MVVGSPDIYDITCDPPVASTLFDHSNNIKLVNRWDVLKVKLVKAIELKRSPPKEKKIPSIRKILFRNLHRGTFLIVDTVISRQFVDTVPSNCFQWSSVRRCTRFRCIYTTYTSYSRIFLIYFRPSKIDLYDLFVPWG